MKTRKALWMMLLIVVFLCACIVSWKLFVAHMIHRALAQRAALVSTVSAVSAHICRWPSRIEAVGSARSAKGISLTPETSGLIEHIAAQPGTDVHQGQLILTLNAEPDRAKLQALEAQAQLAQIVYERNQKQKRIGAISQEQLDQDHAQMDNLNAQVRNQQALIHQKIVKAPFSGRLGVVSVYPGQYITPGIPIATLQVLKPIYVDFYVPQSHIPELKVGQNARIHIDPVVPEIDMGRVTTINPVLDPKMRQILVELTVTNAQERIVPGMFVSVVLDTDKTMQYVTLPQVALVFNPYGTFVYVLEPTQAKQNGKNLWRVRQQFITTGPVHGHYIAVLKGLKPGERVILSGQSKIKNHASVQIQENQSFARLIPNVLDCDS